MDKFVVKRLRIDPTIVDSEGAIAVCWKVDYQSLYHEIPLGLRHRNSIAPTIFLDGTLFWFYNASAVTYETTKNHLFFWHYVRINKKLYWLALSAS